MDCVWILRNEKNEIRFIFSIPGLAEETIRISHEAIGECQFRQSPFLKGYTHVDAPDGSKWSIEEVETSFVAESLGDHPVLNRTNHL